LRRLRLLFLLVCVLTIVGSSDAQLGKFRNRFNVKRKASATPEVTAASPKTLSRGEPQEITLKVANLDANSIKSIEAFQGCSSSKFHVVSQTEAKITLQVPRVYPATDCPLTVETKDGRSFSAFIEVDQSGRDRFGRNWAIEFEDGTQDNWRVTSTSPDGSYAVATDSKGRKVKLSFESGALSVAVSEQCVLSADFNNGVFEGTILGDDCPYESAQTFKARAQ